MLVWVKNFILYFPKEENILLINIKDGRVA